MSDVSCRAFAIVFSALEARDLDPAPIVIGSPLSIDELKNPRLRVPWDDFAYVMHRFSQMVGGPGPLRDIGGTVITLPAYSIVTEFAGLVAGTQDLLRVIPFLGNSMFAPVEAEITDNGPGEATLSLRIPEDLENCPAFFHLTHGNLVGLPTLIGSPPAQVELDLQERYGVFTLHFEAHSRLEHLARLPGRIAKTLAPVRLAEELAREQREMRDQKRELLNYKAQWTALVESAPETILSVDRQGVVQFVNRSLAPLVGKRPVDFLLGEHRKRFQAALDRAFAYGEATPRLAVDLSSPDGADQHFECSIGPVMQQDEVVACTVVARDRTVAVQQQAEREALEEQMRQHQRLEALGLLAGGVAHDFNNLLTAIMANAELAAAQASADDQTLEYLQYIQGASRQAAELTGQMLAYAGHRAASAEVVDLGGMINDISALMQATLPKKVVLHTRMPADLPGVHADRAQLHQVVLNLISNAADSIGANTGRVEVWGDSIILEREMQPSMNRAGIGLAPGRYVRLTVQDDGAGMDDATVQRIFDPFFTTRSEGRGLGLAAVLGIVRGHDGGLIVESAIGHGTTFKVLLPASTSDKIAPVAARPRSTLWKGEGTALVIEDEPLVLKSAQALLRRHGLRVSTAIDGKQGLRAYREQASDIDLVLLDMSMPGLSGEEVFEAIRATHPQVPIILTSAYDVQDRAETLVAEGPSLFLRKPYAAAELNKALFTLLADRAGDSV